MEHRFNKVEQSLARLEERAAHTNQRIEELLERQTRTHKCLHRALHGTTDNPGLMVRVDRLENKSRTMARIMLLVCTAFLPVLGVKLWDLFIAR